MRGRRDITLIRIAVCEDEPVFLEQLTGMIHGILDKYPITYQIETFVKGTALLAREAFDILLLDIVMGPCSGMELAKRLRGRGDEGKIIFITSYERYAVEAYDVQAFHYLVKPVETKKLEEVLLRCRFNLKREMEHTIVVRQGAAVRRIPFREVLYLEVMNRKIYLHTAGETISYYGKLEELEKTLPNLFFKCHRSYIVNLSHVVSYDNQNVRLDYAESIPLSKRRHRLFGLAFMQYLKESGDVF